MNELLPIIRRKRRPLIVAEPEPPVVAANIEPVTVKPEEESPKPETAEETATDANISSKR